MSTLKALCTSTALIGTLLAPATQAATLYRAVDLGTLEQGPTYAYGINNLGQVTGASEVTYSNSFTQMQAFVSSNGVMTRLDGGSRVVRNSVGRDINDLGERPQRELRAGLFPGTFGTVATAIAQRGRDPLARLRCP